MKIFQIKSDVSFIFDVFHETVSKTANLSKFITSFNLNKLD